MKMTARPDPNLRNVEKWTPEVEQLLREWHRRMFACQYAYYTEAERLRRWHLWLGIPAIALSTVVGTAVFATLENQQISISARVAVALVSVAAAILAGLQTFLRLAESASAHAAAGDWYAAIKRDIEELQVLPREDRGHPKACLDALRKEINKAGQKSPELRETLWMKAAKRYGVDEPPPRTSAAA
jgi:hypothetical protein